MENQDDYINDENYSNYSRDEIDDYLSANENNFSYSLNTIPLHQTPIPRIRRGGSTRTRPNVVGRVRPQYLQRPQNHNATPPKITKVSGKGQQFDEDEIKTLLFSLYKGKETLEVVNDYIQTYPTTNRTKQALKVKIGQLRSECVMKFTTSTHGDTEKSMTECYKFLQPAFVVKEEENEKKYFLIQNKKNFKEVKVGFLDRIVRWQLFKWDETTNGDWKGATFDSKHSIVFN